jgi:predicted RNase H-like nuclease
MTSKHEHTVKSCRFVGPQMAWICGVDGFRSRWCAVLRNLDTHELCVRVVSFHDLLELPEHPAIVAVDLPIGLPDVTLSGGRACDRLARAMVGGRRACSIFPAVGRCALTAASRAEADRVNRAGGGIGIGAQAWGLARKLLEVDAVMTPARQHVFHEIHPELSFREMAGRPLAFGKKARGGERERMAALVARGFPESFVTSAPPELRVGRDDFLDACAALWTAGRIYRGAAKRIPTMIERDARGLDMAIWF